MPTDTPTIACPIAQYGVYRVSRPVAARLLGVSMQTLRQLVGRGQLQANGKVKLQVQLSDIEAVTGRAVSVHDYLTALRAPTLRHQEELDGRRL